MELLPRRRGRREPRLILTARRVCSPETELPGMYAGEGLPEGRVADKELRKISTGIMTPSLSREKNHGRLPWRTSIVPDDADLGSIARRGSARGEHLSRMPHSVRRRRLVAATRCRGPPRRQIQRNRPDGHVIEELLAASAPSSAKTTPNAGSFLERQCRLPADLGLFDRYRSRVDRPGRMGWSSGRDPTLTHTSRRRSSSLIRTTRSLRDRSRRCARHVGALAARRGG